MDEETAPLLGLDVAGVTAITRHEAGELAMGLYTQ